ncbi:MAG: flippase-like domain-containing protein [Bacteroidales bacterium]|nr:flippase-like domain-containing protein [Bacteroidales bacterium]
MGGLALAAGLIYLVLRKAEWESFAEGFASCRWGWVLASMACGLLALVLRGLRWRLLLLPFDGGTTRRLSISAYWVGNVFNAILPTSGEWVRCGLVTREKNKFDHVLGTAAAERVIDLLTLAVILGLLAIFGWNFIGLFVTQNIIVPFIAFWQRPDIIQSVSLILLAMAALVALVWLAAKKFRIFSRLKDFMIGILDGFSSIRLMPGKSCFLLETVIIWSLYALQVWAVALALGLSMLPKDALLLSAMGSIASFIPVPGGIGAYHYIIALTLGSLYGMDWGKGLLLATLCHESQLLVAMGCALGGWLILPARKS